MKTSLTLLVLSFAILFTSIPSYAGKVKARAREHYDVHSIERNGSTETYTGLSNTINVWYEEPFDISYGFAFNPILGSAEQDDTSLPEFGNRIRYIHAGFELKYFFLLKPLFTRVGLGWSQLRSDGPLEESNGYHGYVGLGWEFLVGNVGIALEAAYRAAELQNDISTGTITPSIGFHFYML